MSDNESFGQADEVISELGNNISQQEEDEEDSVKSQSSQGRGRPRIQEQWTRVISLSHD